MPHQGYPSWAYHLRIWNGSEFPTFHRFDDLHEIQIHQLDLNKYVKYVFMLIQIWIIDNFFEYLRGSKAPSIWSISDANKDWPVLIARSFCLPFYDF